MASNYRRLVTLSSRALGTSVAASLAAVEKEKSACRCDGEGVAPSRRMMSMPSIIPMRNRDRGGSDDGGEEQVKGAKNNSRQQKGTTDEAFPNLSRHGRNSLLAKHLTPAVYNKLKGRQTQLGVTLEDIIQSGVCLPYGAQPPRGIAGVFAGDAESYEKFSSLLDPLIQEHHRAGHRQRLQRHKTNLDYKGLLQKQIDPAGEFILYTRMRLARSLRGFRFAPCIGRGERRQIEALLRECTTDWNHNNNKNGESSDGKYISIMEMSNRQHQQLVQQELLFPDPDEFAISAGLGRDWPDGRGIYCDSWTNSMDSSDGGDLPNIVIWVNGQDHLWVISNAKGGDVQGVFTRLSKAVWALETSLKQRGHAFVEDRRLGFLNTSPVDIGTALRASFYVKLVRLGQRPEFPNLLRRLRLEAQPVMQSGDRSNTAGTGSGIFDIANAESLGKSEVELINIMIQGVGYLIELERQLENGEEIDI